MKIYMSTEIKVLITRRPCKIPSIFFNEEEEEEEMNFIETHDSYKKLRQKYCLYNYEIVYTL